MRHANAGVTIIEVLVALTVLTIGVLGAAAVAAGSIRSAHRADQSARAARLVGDVVALTTRRVVTAGCVAASGTRTNPTGEQVSWVLRPERGGASLFMEVGFPPAARRRSDSLWSFLRCG